MSEHAGFGLLLCIGNSDYVGTYVKLRACTRNAADVHELFLADFVDGFARGRCKCLPDLSGQGISDAWTAIVEQVESYATVVLFFSGHGCVVPHLSPAGVAPERATIHLAHLHRC